MVKDRKLLVFIARVLILIKQRDYKFSLRKHPKEFYEELNDHSDPTTNGAYILLLLSELKDSSSALIAFQFVCLILFV